MSASRTVPSGRDLTPEPVESVDLPRLVPAGDGVAPAAPLDVAETGVSRATLCQLALKLACTIPRFTTEWAAQQLRLPQTVTSDILEQLRAEHLLEVLGEAGPFGYRYGIAERGHERAERFLEVCGYVGPAPLSLPSYVAFLEWQLARMPRVTAGQVAAALSGLVLQAEVVELVGLAVSSGRSLFLFGSPGNGKTSVGRALHQALTGELWVPRCLVVDSSIIRVHDDQVHQTLAAPGNDQPHRLDQRWVRIRRPLIVVGGEATLQSFDLSFAPALRYYEAPLHVKANGGTFLIDDFGRQRVDPFDLLNRWIIPLEHGVDFLTLHTGQKIQVPFRQMLIVATNLDPEKVTDPAFLRRMGYRVHLNPPTPEQYGRIFERYAVSLGLACPADLLPWLLERYRAEHRDLRGCEPRDLIDRAMDVCRLREQPPHLDRGVLALAWNGYFGAG